VCWVVFGGCAVPCCGHVCWFVVCVCVLSGELVCVLIEIVGLAVVGEGPMMSSVGQHCALSVAVGLHELKCWCLLCMCLQRFLKYGTALAAKTESDFNSVERVVQVRNRKRVSACQHPNRQVLCDAHTAACILASTVGVGCWTLAPLCCWCTIC
jgi:hypothetical protein